jgi:hypothetical protein
VSQVLEPEEILSDLLRLDPALRRERYYGERALFYNPGRSAPLGTILCSIKDRDGPNDKASELPGHDVTQLGVLTPHPVYAWMRWVQILAPSTDSFEALRPLLTESLGLVREKWKRRGA